MEKFKVGDLVYDFRKGGAICKVKPNPINNTPYGLMTVGDNGKYDTYTELGLFSVDDQLPSLVKVNEGNRKALVSIFGDVFQDIEDYEAEPTSENIIKELINKQGFAWCGISDYSEDTARERGKRNLHKIVEVVEDKDGHIEFYMDDDVGFSYAVPFDPNTGDEITNLED